MKPYVLAIPLMLILSACQSDSSSSSESGDTNAPGETFWQLADDSELKIKLTPWPLQSSAPTRVHIEATTGDWDEEKVLVEQVQVGVTTSSSQSAGPWIPLSTARPTADGSKVFEGDVKLPAGKVAFRVLAKGAGYTGGSAGDLQPWELSVN